MQDDLISRQEVLDVIASWFESVEQQRILQGRIKAIPSVEPQVEQWKDFVLWVATEIFDDMWEYNKDSFAEIACRKLAKLGIVRAKGDEWELVEPQEKRCVDCNHYGKLSLDCGRCDDDCSMYEPQESEDRNER